MFWKKKKVVDPIEKLEVISKIGPLKIYGMTFKYDDLSWCELMGKSEDGQWWELATIGYIGKNKVEFHRMNIKIEKLLEEKLNGST